MINENNTSAIINNIKSANNFKMELIGRILLDNTFNQRNSFYNMYARAYGESGLSNPGASACAYFSSMYHVYSKLGYNPSIKELVMYGNSQRFLYPNKRSKETILDEGYYVGGYAALITNAMRNNGSSLSAVVTSKRNADFSIIRFKTSGGKHMVAGDSNGIMLFDPDPSVNVIKVLPPVYLKWR